MFRGAIIRPQMALTSGNCVGSYQILAAIGAGGMGEVYRARDSKLGRDVALKVVPEAFACDAERMARFQREAKVLASLNHTNIASIYGLEDSGATHALVMELVEGPTLADRIKAGAIPIDEALQIAKQICEALEYAHERGIVHRDLKPANVKVTTDDAVKVLDFGLAKALESNASSIDISTSPTISRMATQAGVLLGTAAYMSPEQAKGKQVDRRADIWAFGCVLYEMLTAKQTFTGETVTDTLAAVITKDPDWSQLPAATPIRVRVLLQRCLQKDPKQRLRDIGDARISLDEVLSGAPESSSVGAATVSAPFWRRTIIVSLCTLLFGAAVASLVTWNLKPAPSPPPVFRYVITLPPGQQLAGLENGPGVALSPDGADLAYVATQGGIQQIYLRAMDSLDSKPITGTEGASDLFFSPDGQWLGFFADGKLKKIPVSGGVAQILADAQVPYGASWGNRGIIAFTPTLGGLLQVSEAGGAEQPLTHLENDGEVDHLWPELLPDSKGVLFVLYPQGAIGVDVIGTGKRRILIQGQAAATPRYTLSGHLVYGQGGSLMAVPFDLQRLKVTGTAVPVVESVLQSTRGFAQYGVSTTGSLVYVPGGTQLSQSKLVWVARNGAEQALAAPARDYDQPRLSPDGRRIAVDLRENGATQVGLYDLDRDTLARLTFEGSVNEFPVWTPDGRRIVFQSNRPGPSNLFWQMADGSGGLEPLMDSEKGEVPMSWSSDGQALAVVELLPDSRFQVSVLRMTDRKAQPFLQPGYDDAPEFSPDGHWLAYVSNESGRKEIYVQPYPGPGGKWQISTEGGSEPMWNPKGKELFYRSGDKMMAVDISTQPGFVAGKPRQLFEGDYVPDPYARANYDVSPDGQRFLMLKPSEQTGNAPTQINVVLNWFEELKRRVPPGNK